MPGSKLFSAGLAGTILILVLIFGLSAMSAMSAISAASIESNQPIINEIQITNNTSDQYFPNIYGNTIVWFDFRNENWDMYTYNLSSSREKQIPINGVHPGAPAIYEDTVVWSDLKSSGESPNMHLLSVIYMYNLSTSQKTQISGDNVAFSPVIYGDRVVWMGSLNNGKTDYSDSDVKWNIFMYNLSTFKETQVSPSGSSQMFPAIYEDKIVWMDSRNGGRGNYWNLSGNWDIYMYNLSTSKETQITKNKAFQCRPDIYRDNIVWIDSRNGNQEVFVYNLSTSKEIDISKALWEYDHPSIYGNKIVWMDIYEGNWEVYMYDLLTSTKTKITANSSNSQNAVSPEIYENKIVWENENSGNRDIYIYTVSGNSKVPDVERQPENSEIKDEKNKSLPGFEIIELIGGLLGVFLIIKKTGKNF
jgi:TolB protein